MRSSNFSQSFVPFCMKRALYKAIIINLLLWGCESWDLPESLMHKLKVFHTKCCRTILGISMYKVAVHSVINENILHRVGNHSMDSVIHHHRLCWMRKVARMLDSRLPCKFLIAWCEPPRPTCMSQMTTHASYLSSLCKIGLDSSNSQLKTWTPLVDTLD